MIAPELLSKVSEGVAVEAPTSSRVQHSPPPRQVRWCSHTRTAAGRPTSCRRVAAPLQETSQTLPSSGRPSAEHDIQPKGQQGAAPEVRLTVDAGFHAQLPPTPPQVC